MLYTLINDIDTNDFEYMCISYSSIKLLVSSLTLLRKYDDSFV